MTGATLLVKIAQACRSFEVVFNRRATSSSKEDALTCESIIAEIEDIHVYRNNIAESLVDPVFRLGNTVMWPQFPL